MSAGPRRDDDARARWNRRWAERGADSSASAPAEWLVENSSLLRGGDGRRALDVACGAGRNALYHASLGFEVHAVDVSDVAIKADGVGQSRWPVSSLAGRHDCAGRPARRVVSEVRGG